jgi:hypothetical protein
MIMENPLSRAALVKAITSSGVRCADMMRISCWTPNCLSMTATSSMTGRSDLLPMRMAIFMTTS